ncbi:MAG TPA: glycosyltransferase, partial [Steroidobacteraceae bacterium]|nr:glycosyltransferase [Steroidobacteraceae bacterium]
MTAVVLTFLCVLLLVPAMVFFVEVIAAMLPGDAPPTPVGNEPLRLAVLIPAHDEETTIARTLRSVAAQLSRTDRLLVVADNCSDQTEQI